MSLDPQTLALLTRLAVALAIGLLIGVERGWQDRELPPGGRTAGIRTYALTGFMGGVFAALVPAAGPWLLALGLPALTLVFGWFKYREGGERHDFSVTAVVVAMLDYGLGALAVAGPMQVAIAGAVAMTVLLAARKSLHVWLERMTWKELRSGLLLVAMTFLALPLLPDRTIDPWDAINPHELWLMTIFIAAISGAGYAAVKLAGPDRGLIFGALATGLVSSTSATLTSARRVRDGGSPAFLAASAALSSAMSYARTLAIAVALSLDLARHLVAALVPATAVLGLAVLIAWRRAEKRAGDTASAAGKLDNPIEIGFVLRFGILLAVVFVAAQLTAKSFGQGSFLPLAAITGLVDIDPVTLTAAKLAPKGGAATAALGVLIAIAMNTLSKLVLGALAGGGAFGVRLAVLLGLSLIAGGLGLGAAMLYGL